MVICATLSALFKGLEYPCLNTAILVTKLIYMDMGMTEGDREQHYRSNNDSGLGTGVSTAQNRAGLSCAEG